MGRIHKYVEFSETSHKVTSNAKNSSSVEKIKVIVLSFLIFLGESTHRHFSLTSGFDCEIKQISINKFDYLY